MKWGPNSLTGSNDFNLGKVSDIGRLAMESRSRHCKRYVQQGDLDKAYSLARGAAHVGLAIMRFMDLDNYKGLTNIP